MPMLTLVLSQTRCPILDVEMSELHEWTRRKFDKGTFKSASKPRMDWLTASSVNSGNSLRQWRKVTTSLAKLSNWAGSVSGSKLSSKMSFTTGACWPRQGARRCRCMKFGFSRASRGGRTILRGYRFVAFSRKRNRILVSRSRNLNAEERIPTEPPNWRAAFAKLRSWRPRMRDKRWSQTRHVPLCRGSLSVWEEAKPLTWQLDATQERTFRAWRTSPRPHSMGSHREESLRRTLQTRCPLPTPSRLTQDLF